MLLGNAAFGEHPAGLGNALDVYRLAVATDQMVPERQVLALGHQAVGAGGGSHLNCAASWALS